MCVYGMRAREGAQMAAARPGLSVVITVCGALLNSSRRSLLVFSVVVAAAVGPSERITKRDSLVWSWDGEFKASVSIAALLNGSPRKGFRMNLLLTVS